MLNVMLEERVAKGLTVTDARELQKRLKAIDPILRKELLRDVKSVGKPIQSAIKNNLSSFTPLSGMRGNGRMGFNQVKPFSSTTLSFRTRSSRHANETSLVSVRTNSPLTSVVDMAGKSGRFIGKGAKSAPGYSRSFQRNGKTLRTRQSGQGEAFIRALGKQPSRIVWPAAEKALPGVEAAINQILVRAYQVVNRSFG
jgi:hypothetical protein